MNALARPEVGRYLNARFVSSFQKVGTFRVAGRQKQGGNVAGYFCTPDLRVLHALAGPVNAATLLREARWVVESHKLALLEGADDSSLPAFFREAHAERLRIEHGIDLQTGGGALRGRQTPQAQVHLLLTAAPLARIDQVYKLVFENILGEQVSTAPIVQVR